jgi:hypothetical protein
MHAYAKAHPTVVAGRVGHRIDFRLNGDGRQNRAGGRVEGRQHRVSSHVDDPALVGFDLRFECLARSIQHGHGRALIHSHQARAPRNIRGQDGSQPLPEFRVADQDVHHSSVWASMQRAGRFRRSRTTEPGLSRPAGHAQALRAARLAAPKFRQVPQVWRHSDPDQLFARTAMDTVRAAANGSLKLSGGGSYP